MTNSSRIVSIIFDVNTETSRPRFNVPSGITELLGLKPKSQRDEIALVIREARSGKPLYAGTQRLKSRTEIYGAKDVSAFIRKKQRIRVEASRP